MHEEARLSGPLEPTNEPDAIAKIAGVKLAENDSSQLGRHYCAVMPTNRYEANDRYDVDNSRVLPAHTRKAHKA